MVCCLRCVVCWTCWTDSRAPHQNCTTAVLYPYCLWCSGWACAGSCAGSCAGGPLGHSPTAEGAPIGCSQNYHYTRAWRHEKSSTRGTFSSTFSANLVCPFSILLAAPHARLTQAIHLSVLYTSVGRCITTLQYICWHWPFVHYPLLPTAVIANAPIISRRKPCQKQKFKNFSRIEGRGSIRAESGLPLCQSTPAIYTRYLT